LHSLKFQDSSQNSPTHTIRASDDRAFADTVPRPQTIAFVMETVSAIRMVLRAQTIAFAMEAVAARYVPQSSVEYYDILGRGTYSEVYRVSIHSKAGSESCSSDRTLLTDLESTETEPDDADGIAVKDTFYALKRLKRSFQMENGTIFRINAAADLAMEAKILSNLPSHSNIIGLRAISEDFFSDPSTGFLILDGMKETLLDVITKWRKEAKCNVSLALLRTKSRRSLEAAREVSRACTICLPVARAMSFIHAHRISYRDIKPSNIGFDASGNVRLFDFGLARVYDPDHGSMTPCTGSTRYMSPEVMAGHSYDLSADVYSYAILLWEVCNRALQQPFASVRSIKAAKRCVVGRRYRPPIQHIYSDILRQVLRYGWHPDPQLRPSFSVIVSQLEELEAMHSVSRP
jgi:serine/threonine protein kinase